MKISKIVLTGGPCAGKTTGMSWIQNAFTQRGYSVIFVSESASEVIMSGVSPKSCSSIDEFQKAILRLQIEKERIYSSAAQYMNSDKVLMIFDRGVVDNKAYSSREIYDDHLSEHGLTEAQAMHRYDAVFHLVTAAKGAREYYTLANNPARSETPDQAAEKDDLLIAAWTGHPHFRIVENVAGFEYKMQQLISEIAAFLGEQAPANYKRKFLIEYPDIEALASNPGCCKVKIVQTYLKTEGDEEARLRCMEAYGEKVYCEIRKKVNSGRNPIETERRLTPEEYAYRLKYADPDKKPLTKDRYCIVVGNQYFEIDVYPFWTDQAIAGVKMNVSDEAINFPDGIKAIREVTEEEEYRNSALAQSS